MNPYLDRNETIEVTGGRLPHWFQPNKIQFITFRLVDSLPQIAIKDLIAKKLLFLNQNPEPWSIETFKRYWQLIGKREDELLYKGYGSCVLRNSEIRSIVSETINYFNEIRYHIYGYVIMPNHVHILLQPISEQQLKKILCYIKGFSAKQINRHLNRTGAVWMKQSFDRIIRSKEHLRRCMHYIAQNPHSLPPTDYTLYLP